MKNLAMTKDSYQDHLYYDERIDIAALSLEEMPVGKLIELVKRLAVAKIAVPDKTEVISAFLDEYTNDAFARIAKELTLLEKGTLEKDKQEVIAEMIAAFHEGTKKMENYYNRRHLLYEITACVRSFGYCLDWFTSKAREQENTLVYHFRDRTDEYSLVITAKDTDQANQYIVETDIFYDYEEEGDEKETILEDIMETLNKTCRWASFQCIQNTGHGLEPAYNSIYEVRSMNK